MIPKDPGASLVDALQNLVLDMTRASRDSEIEEGLKRLKEIRGIYMGKGATDALSARKQAEALIAWVEQQLEQMRQQLARKRRRLEGEAMEKIAKQREAEGPSLLPTELIDAVVRATASKEPEEQTASHPQRETGKTAPKKKLPAGLTFSEKKAEPKAEKKKDPAEKEKKPAESGKPLDWTRYELLAAHLAACIREDSGYFEKLRKSAKRKRPKHEAPQDHRAAQNFFQTVHDLNKRLVLIEMNAKALTADDDGRRKRDSLLKDTAREIRSFTRDLRNGKLAMPEMAQELDRVFGGMADCFASMKPEKGRDILEQCAAERQPQPRREDQLRREMELEAPLLVLRRDDSWDR